MKKHSKETTNKIIQSLELPQDLFLGLSNISLCGNREVYLSNHRGILSYGQTELNILLKNQQLIIKGNDLNIYSYTKEDLTIKGYIKSMEFI